MIACGIFLPTSISDEIPDARFRTVFDSLNVFHGADIDGRAKHTCMRTPFLSIAGFIGLKNAHELLTHAQLGLTCLEGGHEIINGVSTMASGVAATRSKKLHFINWLN